MMTINTYKQQLLEDVKQQIANAGGQLRVDGRGKRRHVSLLSATGKERVIYFPTGSALHGQDVDDLKEAAQQTAAA